MPLMFHNGSLLFRNGVLAMGEDCCCAGSVCVYLNTLYAASGCKWRTSEAVPFCPVLTDAPYDCMYGTEVETVLENEFRGSSTVGLRFSPWDVTLLSASRQLGGVGTRTCLTAQDESSACYIQNNGVIEVAPPVYSTSPEYWTRFCLGRPMKIAWSHDPVFSPMNIGSGRYAYATKDGEKLFLYNPGGFCTIMDDLPCAVVPRTETAWCTFRLYTAADVKVRVVRGEVTISKDAANDRQSILSTSTSGEILLR